MSINKLYDRLADIDKRIEEIKLLKLAPNFYQYQEEITILLAAREKIQWEIDEIHINAK